MYNSHNMSKATKLLTDEGLEVLNNAINMIIFEGWNNTIPSEEKITF